MNPTTLGLQAQGFSIRFLHYGVQGRKIPKNSLQTKLLGEHLDLGPNRAASFWTSDMLWRGILLPHELGQG